MKSTSATSAIAAAFLVQGGVISQLTTDHNYAAQQLALGLISARDAATSDMRCMLTRSIGRELTVQVDYHTVAGPARRYPRAMLATACTFASPSRRFWISSPKNRRDEACRELIQLAERRGTDDNLSVQIIQVERVNTLSYFRGQPVFHEAEIPMTLEVEVGEVLDNRFKIESVVSRSGMASIFKATDLKSGETVAVKVPFMRFESDPAFYSRFQREEEIGKTLDHPGLLKIISDRRQEPALYRHGVSRRRNAPQRAALGQDRAGRRGGRYRRPICAMRSSTCTSTTSCIAI